MTADLFTLTIIAITSIFSFFMGVYSLSKFIFAYRENKNLYKAKGYLINAFVMVLLIPFLIITIGLKFSNTSPINPIVELKYTTSSYSNLKLTSPESFKVEKNRNSDTSYILNLQIKNDYPVEERVVLEFSCVDEPAKCKNAYDILLETKIIEVSPKVSIDLPITILIGENTPKDDYLFEIRVKDSKNRTYDFTNVKISLV